ncbi:capsular polysaccharide biosynthesis protein [Primorskyibacter sp. S87]|uniref:capsular polysaccharide biosynthesis protein n=1 Tax=Primorskyibacter sp. S87 TaxID=3415126 RepID=UPI003C7C2821
MHSDPDAAAGGEIPRLFFFNGGFLTQSRLRRILSLAGYRLTLGMPGPKDMVAVWGQSPTAHRGEQIAAKRDAALLRVEDAFLRSLHPGRAGEPPLGLCLDRSGVHFNPDTQSDLEQLLSRHPLDDTALLDRARACIARLKEAHLTKYSAVDTEDALPDPGYVLVVDQTQGDASVVASKADAATFREMLVFAQEENPGARIVIKTHPETRAGFRSGYFDATHTARHIMLWDKPCSPWSLLEGAVGVYTVSSQLGFEAILAGHKPRVFGQPFYAGWGLTRDEHPVPRRERRLTRAQLFAAAMILYPVWYDPYRDELCELETALDTLEAQARAWRQDRHGWVATGMRLWKRRPLQKMFGQQQRMIFSEDIERASTLPRPWMVWAGKATNAHAKAVRVEDGFLRSRGLGAELVPALSLVADRKGIYYDPSQPSELEDWITRREKLRPDQQLRVERLVQDLIRAGLSKYNLGATCPELPSGRKILVPGQVEDDASILKGTDKVSTNLTLLQTVRAARPEATIIYKPHPDVEAGLRVGSIDAKLADMVLTQVDPSAILDEVDEVWTMTSLMGFEALLRGVRVTTLGTPFYAGWGLTTDLGTVPDRRKARPELMGLAHAALIDYPRYLDPVTGLPCPVEVVVERLRDGKIPSPGPINRSLAKLQGLFATAHPFWR